ncbi:hypothetical protein PPL_06508 [Heterostelium album PN500]|uniref:Uncharacterized protein n=1 Tax=Heterostelium pallidum (strain ATCC 26659 / Pp 5 / PN500) TaxID=670386 RepID=D3BDC5_HETP5|nr:hypothetical protein PPL_06508 [Heterostelium album PN500]EFA80569.1 hypothetical protein PPL_06508 [Heterostelium album PN500]|eukprot:XP_020432689.1 hypothetical protein PPL_06508 [Heterostelium album PN500]
MNKNLYVILFKNKLLREKILGDIRWIHKTIEGKQFSWSWSELLDRPYVLAQFYDTLVDNRFIADYFQRVGGGNPPLTDIRALVLELIRHNRFEQIKFIYQLDNWHTDMTTRSAVTAVSVKNYIVGMRLQCAKYGHLEILDYFYSGVFPQPKTATEDLSVFNIAINKRHFDIVKYMARRLYPSELSVALDNLIYFVKDLELLKSVVEICFDTHKDFKLTIDRFFSAIKANSLEIVQYLYEKINSTGGDGNAFKINGITDYLFAESKRIEILKWLDATIPEVLVTYYCNTLLADAFRKDELEPIQYLYHRKSISDDKLALPRSKSIIKWLHFNTNYQFTKKVMDLSAQLGKLKTVQFLHQHRSEGCTTDAIDSASLLGYLDIIIYLHENRTEGCSSKAMFNAACHGRLGIVRWLHENVRTTEFDQQAMDVAARTGHLNVVQFLHENRTEGCSPKTFNDTDYLPVLKFLYLNRTEGRGLYPFKFIDTALRQNDMETAQWVFENLQDRSIPYPESNFNEHIKRKKSEPIQFLLHNFPECQSYTLTQNDFFFLVSNGLLDIFKMVQGDRPLAFNVGEIDTAALYVYLTESCLIGHSLQAFAIAASNGHLEILKYMVDRATKSAQPVVLTVAMLDAAITNKQIETANITQSLSISNTILKLQEIVENYQIKKDQEYIQFIQFAEKKGEFPSQVHYNFFGNDLKTEERRHGAIPDSNMFVTNFVLYTLLESERYGGIKISENVVANAISAILSFKDGNFPEDTPVFTFWPQTYNSTFDVYSQNPTNLDDLMNHFGGFQRVVDYFAKIFNDPEIIADMSGLAQMVDGYKQVFHIPSDADDSGCNLALGNLLYQLSDKYPSEWSTWNQKNVNISALFDVYLKYAYRPFSNSVDQNTIDQRTYYAIHGFLEQWNNTDGECILPGTWFNSVTQQIETYPILQMPFNVNNVDLSVATNSLYGIISGIQTQPEAKQYLAQSKDLQNLCISVTKLIVYGIESGLVYDRPDLALLYYPSIYDFSWFVSRLMYNLEELQTQSPLPYPLPYILNTLTTLMQGTGTSRLLSKMINQQYWDDFLGENSTNIFGKPESLGEDRFFSTALAVNALIDTWTVPNSNPTSIRVWRSNTPSQVKSAVNAAVQFINDNILENPDQTYNAFFSGSVKSNETLAFFYPTNYCVFFNGTNCDPHFLYPASIENIVSGMSGVVSSEEYAQLIPEIWAGAPTPTEFHGFNFQPFPYWSSNSLSYSISLLSLVKYQDLNN